MLSNPKLHTNFLKKSMKRNEKRKKYGNEIVK